jgi:hypothetical protein
MYLEDRVRVKLTQEGAEKIKKHKFTDVIVDEDEVECTLANLILYFGKGLHRYIVGEIVRISPRVVGDHRPCDGCGSTGEEHYPSCPTCGQLKEEVIMDLKKRINLCQKINGMELFRGTFVTRDTDHVSYVTHTNGSGVGVKIPDTRLEDIYKKALVWLDVLHELSDDIYRTVI